MARPTTEEVKEREALHAQGLKKCGQCKRILPLSDFTKNTAQWDRLQSHCRSCLSAYMHDYYLSSEKYRARRATPERRRVHGLRQYGITPERFDAMRAKQDGKCAICGEVPSPSRRLVREVHAGGLHVDHDHTTMKVRGLLCNSCNNGLGRFRHDPVRLRSAISYLRKHDAKGGKC